MMKKRWLSLLLAGVLAVSALTACSSSDTSDAEEDTTAEETSEDTSDTSDAAEDESTGSLTGEGLNEADSVTIGYIGTISISVLADQLYGILEDDLDGITVNYEKFESGPDAITAVATDDLDILISVGTLPVVTAGANGTEFKIISSSGPAVDTYITVPADSDVESLADVSGLKIGVPLGTMSQYALIDKLEENGLSVDDVELINLSGQDLVTAFSGGEVDVMVNNVSLSQSLIDSGDAVKIDEADATYMYVLGNETFLEENPEITAEVLAYFEDVYAYIAADEETVLAEVAESAEAETETIQVTYNSYGKSYLTGVGDEQISQLESVLQFALDNELISEEYDIESYIDTTYVEEAIALASE